jgi:hypothetical protein
MPAPVLTNEKEQSMAVMIGVDPHKGSHTAVALDDREQPLGELRVRSAANQVEAPQLLCRSHAGCGSRLRVA